MPYDTGPTRTRTRQLLTHQLPSTRALIGWSTPSMDHPPAKGLAGLHEGSLIGRYVVLEQVGKGGMGIVYRAYDPKLRREVAIKILQLSTPTSSLRSGAEARFWREAQAMAQLSHANVLPVYDVDAVDDELFIAMEYVVGDTLQGWTEDTDRSWREVVAAFVAAGRGLHAAHQIGLVHRDFKPSNVMVGRDGRVRVMDFGLALADEDRQSDPAPAESATAWSAPLSSRLTRVDVVVGTPAYMAPEQHFGHRADARSDQFSFCVALYEALYGQRPYDGSRDESLAKHKVAGELAEPPAGRGVPARIYRIIRRGLAPRPERRWESMAELIAELDRDCAGAQRRWLRLAGGGFLILGGAAGLLHAQSAIGRLCTGAESKLDGVWDSGRRQSIRAAFSATAVPYAEDAWTRVDATIDAYAGDWVTAHVEACEATNVRGEQSEDMLDRRMACLATRHQDLAALLDVLEVADAEVVERAVLAAHRLPPVEQCSDLSFLLAEVQPPADDDIALQVVELREGLAHVQALHHAGKNPEGITIGTEVLVRARALGYRPLLSEVQFQLGRLHEAAGDYEAAERELARAYFHALASQHGRQAIAAASGLALVVGERLARPDEGAVWAKHGQAMLDTMGAPAAEEAQLRSAEGAILFAKGNYTKARDAFARALELDQALAANDLRVAGRLANLGSVTDLLGNLDEAIVLHRRALDIQRAALGDNHPDVATTLQSVGTVLARLGRYQESVEHHRRALAILEAAFGASHPGVAAANNSMAWTLMKQGRLEIAAEHAERALSALELTFSPNHPRVAGALNSLGAIVRRQGHHEQAIGHHRRAIRLLEAAFGPDHPEIAGTRNNLAMALHLSGDVEGATASMGRALSAQERMLGSGHPRVSRTHYNLGELLLEQGQPERARRQLERSLAARERFGASASALARTRFALARALWPKRGQRTRALALARKAAVDWGEGDEVRTWLDRRASP